MVEAEENKMGHAQEISVLMVNTKKLPLNAHVEVSSRPTSLNIGVYLHSNFVYVSKDGPEVIKLFSCLAQLSMKFQLLIKTKILTTKEVS